MNSPHSTTVEYGSIPQQQPPQNHHYDRTELTKEDHDLLQADRPGYGTRSKVEVAFNQVNGTVGAGIMGLPYAIAHAGFGLGILASVWVAVVSQLGLYMLILAGTDLGIYKFAVLVEHVMGRFGYHFLNFIVVMQAGGSSVGYFILLGDTLPVLFERYLPQWPLLANRTVVVSAIGILCILPLNFQRSIGSLARWSILSVMCLPVILLTIMIRAPVYYDATSPPEWTWVGSDVFGALGIMAFAFSCSHVAFSNFLTLRDQTHAAWRGTIILSGGMCWLVSMSLAIVGYVCFGSKVQANLFMNFASDDAIVNIGRFALGLSMIFTIPMGFYPTREAIQKSLGYETATKQPSNFEHYLVTFVLFFVMLFLGITVRSLGKVYSLVGGFSATSLAYIFPGIAYLVARRRRCRQNRRLLTLTPSTAPSFNKDNDGDNDVQSCSSSPPFNDAFLSDQDTFSETVGPNLITNSMAASSVGALDIMAVLLILWGLLVMFTSINGVITKSS